MKKLLPAALLLALSLAAQAPPAEEAEALREQARGLLRQAATVALEAEPRDRTKLLSDIASLQWKLGDHEAANKNFALAQQALETVQGNNEADPPHLRPLAVTAARVYAGDLEGAAKTLERIEDPAARKQAIEVLAWGRAKDASTLEEAEAARALRDKEAGDRTAAGIVSRWAKEGDREKARALADTIGDPKYKGQALLVLATTPAEIRAARALLDPQTADFQCSMLAYRKAEEGQFELARTFAGGVADPAKTKEVFESVASIEKRIRDKEAGKPPAVDESGFFYGRGAATCWLEVPATPELGAQVEAVINRALAGDFKGALELVTQLPSKEMQENLLVSLTAYRAYKQDMKGAHATADRLRRPDCRAFALHYLAGFEIRVGDLEAATATIGAMPDSLMKGRALTQLAGAQIKAGKSDAALTTLESAHRHVARGEISMTFIPAFQQRAPAMAHIAVLQARLGAREQAAQTFAEASEMAIAGGGEEEGTWTTLEIVAQAHARAGLVAEGIAFVQAAPVKNRLSVIRHLMGVTAREYQAAEPVVVADNLTIPAQKASALLGVAEGLELRATYGRYKWPE